MSRYPSSADTRDSLPSTILDRREFYRICSARHPSSIFFSRSADARFTPRKANVGVLYLGMTLESAIAETICRNAAFLHEDERGICASELADLMLHGVLIQNPITVLDLTVDHLARYRLDSRLACEYDVTPLTGHSPYRWCPDWADKAVDLGYSGILYPSRHSRRQHCLALFESGRPFVTERVIGGLDRPIIYEILEQDFDWSVFQT